MSPLSLLSTERPLPTCPGERAFFLPHRRPVMLLLMTRPRGESESYADLDLSHLTSESDFAHAQERISCARIDAASRGAVPAYEKKDIGTVSAECWRILRQDELGDEQPEGPGGRLYLLAFDGLVRYIKVGMIKGRKVSTLRERVRDHERAAQVHHCFLFDAWASQPCATEAAAKQWEENVLERLNRLVDDKRVRRVHHEYFYGVPFGMAAAAIERERSRVVGAPRHAGMIHGRA